MQPLLRLTGNPIFRLACFASALFATSQIFWLGAKPVAVNLINPPWDKLAHSFTFLVICFLLWFATGMLRRLSVICLVAGVAAADELHQLWLPGRSAEWHDLMADALGIAIFWSIAYCLTKVLNAASIAPSSTRSD
jgi:VanZ family protein